MRPELLALATLLLHTCQGKVDVELNKDESYLVRNNITINYTSCNTGSDSGGIVFHDNDDYEVYDEVDPVCHFNRLFNTSATKSDAKVKEEYPGVHQCCPFHGFIEFGICNGGNGNETDIRFSYVPVCLKPNNMTHFGEKIAYEKTTLSCSGKNANLVSGFLENNKASLNVTLIENNTLLEYKTEESTTTYSDFCIGLKCDSDDAHFKHWFEACDDCDVSNATKEIIGRHNESRLCCSPEGRYDPNTQKCTRGTLEDRINCTDSFGRFALDEHNNEIEGADCFYAGCDGSIMGLHCNKPCEGKKKCFGMCHENGTEVDPITRKKVEHELASDPARAIGLPTETLAYNFPAFHSPTMDSLILYPEKCDDQVVFHDDGSLSLVNTDDGRFPNSSIQEFCLNVHDRDYRGTKGSYSIRTYLTKTKVEAQEGKNIVYYNVVMCISITALIVTIAIYGSFYSRLMRHKEYIKIMINFASSLLLAFLTLVIMQNIGSEDGRSKGLCTSLSLINQFSFLSAFCLMAMMSFHLFDQLRKMKPKKSDNFGKKIGLCYGVPFLITLITLIVEIEAPRCADYRPQFDRSCHFHGGFGKFLWLYLPILILLLLNTGMGIYVVSSVYTNKKSSGDGGKLKDQVCTYLRLFLGMGVPWYAEIIAFGLTSSRPDPRIFYFTDTLNMLQGVWVFFIFVFKKNVLDVLSKKKKELYSRAMSKSGKPDATNQSMTMATIVSDSSTAAT